MVKRNDVPCNLCGSTERNFLFDAKDRLHGYEGTFTYVRCRECGLVYMNPRLSADDIGQFYPSDYGPHQNKAEKRQRNPRVLKSKLKKDRFIAPIYGKLTKQSRLLDVGCGNADFLSKIKTATKCHADGIDISKAAARTAKENHGLDIFTGRITESPFPDGYFDIITSWWHLEHVTNPSEVLQKIYDLLKLDGCCVIGIPNIDSFNAKMFKDRWYHLDCPRHLYIYSPDTITKLLEKTGFVVTKIVFDKSPWDLFPSLRYYFGDDNIPLKYRKKLRGSSLLKKLLLPLTVLLALLKQSDIMVVYARKKGCSRSAKIKNSSIS